MTQKFKQVLLKSIPFERDSRYFHDYSESAHQILEFNAVSPKDLLKLLSSRKVSDKVRKDAISFLGWLKYRPAVSALTKIACSKAEPAPMRRSAMFSLATLSNRGLPKVLSDLALKDSNPDIRIDAVWASSRIRRKKVFRLLKKIAFLDDDVDVRGHAIRAISSLASVDREKMYRVMLKKSMDLSESPTLRAYAIEGLGNAKVRKAIDVVIKNLDHDSPEIRFMAAYALGELGDARHVSLLQKMTEDQAVFEDWGTVAEAAKEAIEYIQHRQTWK